MISFRVTSEEFERFRTLCLQRGLRSLSEVVRLAVNHLIETTPTLATESSLAVRVTQLELRLHHLETRLTQSARLVIEAE